MQVEFSWSVGEDPAIRVILDKHDLSALCWKKISSEKDSEITEFLSGNIACAPGKVLCAAGRFVNTYISLFNTRNPQNSLHSQTNKQIVPSPQSYHNLKKDIGKKSIVREDHSMGQEIEEWETREIW